MPWLTKQLRKKHLKIIRVLRASLSERTSRIEKSEINWSNHKRLWLKWEQSSLRRRRDSKISPSESTTPTVSSKSTTMARGATGKFTTYRLIAFSFVIIPGTSLLPKGLMGFVYLMWLLWLFVGISIVSDIFME